MIKFSIFIPSYNRQNIVKGAIESILNQSYQNFEILLLDNGSQPPLDYLQFSDPRIRFFRNENNIDSSEAILDKICGTHFLFLGDDDALVPDALEIVKEIFDSDPEIQSLSTGFVNYDHINKVVSGNDVSSQYFSGDLQSYDAWESMLFYFNDSWGIGEKKNYKGPKNAHPSAHFLKKDLIDQTRKSQKELFIKPYIDVGYIGTLLHIKKTYYLNLPLTIIGQTNSSDSMGIEFGKRASINPRYLKELEYTPLKGISFINIAVDTHLKVIYRNKLETRIDCRLRPQFYFRHLQAVISDSPWTKQTIKDIYEVLPYLLKSLIQIRSVNGVINTYLSAISFYKPIFWIIKVKVKKILGMDANKKVRWEKPTNTPEKIHFLNINDAGKWIEERYVRNLWPRE